MPAIPVLKPNHPEVARGILQSLIARAGITSEEFLEALGK
jgi:hypothetical protein